MARTVVSFLTMVLVVGSWVLPISRSPVHISLSDDPVPWVWLGIGAELEVSVLPGEEVFQGSGPGFYPFQGPRHICQYQVSLSLGCSWGLGRNLRCPCCLGRKCSKGRVPGFTRFKVPGTYVNIRCPCPLDVVGDWGGT